MKSFQLAVIPGDGIGREVMPAAVDVLQAIGSNFGIQFRYDHYDWSCETFAQTGQMMPDDALTRLRDHDAILLGAVGFPGVPDHVSLWGMLIPIRRDFEQYVNLRPVRLMPGVVSPLRNAEEGSIDFWIVRENSEGEYSQVGGVFGRGTASEQAQQTAIFTRRGTDRIIRYAFELAERLERRHVSSATKSNGIYHSMPYWDSRFEAIADEYPGTRTDKHHIDILTARFVLAPEQFDVVVASNLFGDILSDLGPAITGTIGIAPSANLNPEGDYPSMFEPVHGSAPDIAGQGIANPIGQIWSTAMMLDHLGETDAGAAVVTAIRSVLSGDRTRLTRDLGGSGTTVSLTKDIVAAL